VVLDERVLSAATNRARGDWAVIRLSKRFTLFTFIVNRLWIKELSAKSELTAVCETSTFPTTIAGEELPECREVTAQTSGIQNLGYPETLTDAGCDFSHFKRSRPPVIAQRSGGLWACSAWKNAEPMSGAGR
jgi:hypothetical protein